MNRLLSKLFSGTLLFEYLIVSFILLLCRENCTGSVSEPDKVLIIIGHSIYQTGLLTEPVEVYKSDILKQGWEASVIYVSPDDPEADFVCPDEIALKNVIKSYYQMGYKGIVFIGSKDIPVAWWRFAYSDPDGCDPTDLYYSDMDEWTSRKDSMYVSFDTNGVFVGSRFGPEMFCGRICARGITADVNQEAREVASYLEKIHRYRVNNGNLTSDQKNRALTFLHSDSYNFKNSDTWPENAACSNLRTLCDENVTNRLNFVREMEKGYRFVNIRSHSGHTSNDFVNTDLLKEIEPKFNFLNLFGCGACTYTTYNLGAAYLFFNDYSLNIVGSTGGWGVAPDEKFYRDLNEGMPVGIAFQAFINRDITNTENHPPYGEAGWPKGVLLGDPLITYTAEIKTYKTPMILTDFLNLQAYVGSEFKILLTTSNPDMRSFHFEMINRPVDAKIVNNTLCWTPMKGSEGIHVFEIKAVDDIDGEYSEMFTVTVKSTDDCDKDKAIQLVPNPSEGEFYVMYTTREAQQSYITITNLIGQTFYSVQFDSVKGINRKNIRVKDLRAGTYILNLATGGNCYTGKLLIID